MATGCPISVLISMVLNHSVPDGLRKTWWCVRISCTCKPDWISNILTRSTSDCGYGCSRFYSSLAVKRGNFFENCQVKTIPINLFSDKQQTTNGKFFRKLGTIQTPVRPRTTIKGVHKSMIQRSRSVLELEMTSCVERKPRSSVGLEVTNELDSRTRKVSQYIRPARQSSAFFRSRLPTREAYKNETDKPKHPGKNQNIPHIFLRICLALCLRPSSRQPTKEIER